MHLVSSIELKFAVQPFNVNNTSSWRFIGQQSVDRDEIIDLPSYKYGVIALCVIHSTKMDMEPCRQAASNEQ